MHFPNQWELFSEGKKKKKTIPPLKPLQLSCFKKHLQLTADNALKVSVSLAPTQRLKTVFWKEECSGNSTSATGT